MVRDMRMSSAQLLGETGASSRGGSFHFGFHSHLQPCDHHANAPPNELPSTLHEHAPITLS